jgi:hypothetical protein
MLRCLKLMHACMLLQQLDTNYRLAIGRVCNVKNQPPSFGKLALIS